MLTQQTHDMKNLVLSLKSTVTLSETSNNSNLDKVHLIPTIENNNNENLSEASSFKSLNDECLLDSNTNATSSSVYEDTKSNKDETNDNIKVVI